MRVLITIIGATSLFDSVFPVVRPDSSYFLIFPLLISFLVFLSWFLFLFFYLDFFSCFSLLISFLLFLSWFLFFFFSFDSFYCFCLLICFLVYLSWYPYSGPQGEVTKAGNVHEEPTGKNRVSEWGVDIADLVWNCCFLRYMSSNQ